MIKRVLKQLQISSTFTDCKKHLINDENNLILKQTGFRRKKCLSRTFIYKVYDTTGVPQIEELTVDFQKYKYIKLLK